MTASIRAYFRTLMNAVWFGMYVVVLEVLLSRARRCRVRAEEWAAREELALDRVMRVMTLAGRRWPTFGARVRDAIQEVESRDIGI